jgi:hypothetical protein
VSITRLAKTPKRYNYGVTRYIAYSLYGNDPKYLSGAIENAKSVNLIYPKWTAIFYCGLSVGKELKAKLVDYGCQVQEIEADEDDSASLWRYQALFKVDAEVVLFRDTDSRLTTREAEAVSEWLESGKSLHVIRDHPNHTAAILGGAWGVRAEELKHRSDLFSIEGYERRYGLDQEVLRRKIYRDKSISRLIHDSYFVRELNSRTLPFSTTREFIGEVFSAKNQPDPHGRAVVQQYLSSRRFRLMTQLKHLKNLMFDLASDSRETLTRKPQPK